MPVATRDRVPLARALAQTDAFVDDFDWRFVSKDGLRVVDAWSMATAWQSTLQGHLSVVEDKDDDLESVIPKYKWVCVFLGCDTDVDHATRVAAAARATSLVWRALGACPGFGVQEFPVFWKRVVDAIQRPREDAHTGRHRYYPDVDAATGRCVRMHVNADTCVMDVKGFFEGVAFPRFLVKLSRKLGADGVEKMVRVFCGVDQTAENCGDEEEETLTATLRRLSRFACPEATRSAMELLLRFTLDLTTTSRVNSLLRGIQTRRPRSGLDADDDNEMNALSHPQYVVVAVNPRLSATEPPIEQLAGYPSYTDEWARAALQVGRSLGAPITSQVVGSFQHDTMANRHDFRAFVKDALALQNDSNHHGVRTLGFVPEFRSEWAIGAMCSALPYSRSLVSFRVEMLYARLFSAVSIPNDIVPWLAYALFHPDTNVSSWRSLHFKRVRFGYENADQRKHEMMARGNNLLVALGMATDERPVLVDAYYSATVRSDTVIYSKADPTAAVVQVVEGHANKPLDVCVATTDVSSLDEWVAVVIAGYGLAWIQSSAIESIVARPPGRSFLAGLCITTESDIPEAYAAALIQSAGRELQCVDLKGHDQSVMPGFDQWCPRLERLRIKDDTWSGSPCMRLMPLIPPTVRELHLFFPSSFEPLEKSIAWFQDRPLPNLETLYVICMRNPTDGELDGFVRPALQFFPRLQRLMWLNRTEEEDRRARPIPTPWLSYAQMRYVARAVMKQGPATGATGATGAPVVTPPQATAVALLSVVDAVRVDQQQQQQRALGQLSRELVRQIVDFGKCTAPCELWLHRYTVMGV